MDPCNDFYSYACGGFFKEHKLFPNESQINAFTILHEKNLEVLRHALQNISIYSKVHLHLSIILFFYVSCNKEAEAAEAYRLFVSGNLTIAMATSIKLFG